MFVNTKQTKETTLVGPIQATSGFWILISLASLLFLKWLIHFGGPSIAVEWPFLLYFVHWNPLTFQSPINV